MGALCPEKVSILLISKILTQQVKFKKYLITKMIILQVNTFIHASNFISFITIILPFIAMDDLGNY
jgi:hypothetical protein